VIRQTTDTSHDHAALVGGVSLLPPTAYEVVPKRGCDGYDRCTSDLENRIAFSRSAIFNVTIAVMAASVSKDPVSSFDADVVIVCFAQKTSVQVCVLCSLVDGSAEV